MELKSNRDYETTSDRRTYKLKHRNYKGICCRKCMIRSRQTWYRIGTKKSKFPSWKLVSKNTKQWMEKDFKYEDCINPLTGELWSTTITW